MMHEEDEEEEVKTRSNKCIFNGFYDVSVKHMQS
jgi:hypothetical protein